MEDNDKNFYIGFTIGFIFNAILVIIIVELLNKN